MAIVPAGKHTLFLLVQQPELFRGWADAPYSWGKLPVSQRYLPTDLESGSAPRGYLFQIYLTDQFGIVRGMRMATVTPTFTQALDNALRQQARHLADFSVSAHDAEVAEAYRRWPRPDDMVRSAVAIETLGLPFGPVREG